MNKIGPKRGRHIVLPIGNYSTGLKVAQEFPRPLL